MAHPFYSEFSVDQAVALDLPTAAVSVTASAKPSMTDDVIASRVMGAVVAIMGAAIGLDQPLVEAGLDSLGEALLL